MITRVPGIRVGHCTDLEGVTGCTVVLAPAARSARARFEAARRERGRPTCSVPACSSSDVNAVLLTGGSAFGLAAADGVMRWLEEQRDRLRGRRRPRADRSGRGAVRPRRGRRVREAGAPRRLRAPARPRPTATSREGTRRVPGRVPPSRSSTVPSAPSRAGIGSAVRRGGRLLVGALAAVNALGEVDRPRTAAGRAPDPRRRRRRRPPRRPSRRRPRPGDEHAGSCVVRDQRQALEGARAPARASPATKASLRRSGPRIRCWDGDTVFTLATGRGRRGAAHGRGTRRAGRRRSDPPRGPRSRTPLDGVPAIGGGDA